MNVNISEFVVTLIRFLGAGTLPFCFAGAIQLAHCDACSMQISQGAARSPAISREQRELAISTLRPALRLIPVFNMHKLYWPSETKWQRTCSWESDEYHNEFWDIYVYFTSGSILKIRKSEEYYSFTVFFFTKWFGGGGGGGEQTEVCPDFFRHVTAEIPDGKKLVTRSVKWFLTSGKRFSK